MKVFAFSLSFFIMALSLNPCVDRPFDNALQKMEIGNTTDHNHEGQNDHCSPFCTCQCCQTTCFVPDFISENLTIESVLRYSEYILIFKSTNLSEFLIPPKA